MSTRPSFSAARLLFAAVLVFCFALASAAQTSMTVRRDLHHDLSQPLTVMMKNAPKPDLHRREVEPMKLIPLPPGAASPQDDPVIQHTVAGNTPTAGLNFEGLGAGQYGFTVASAPPDTNGTVGATQYVQWVNSYFAIFNKSTGALVAGPTAGNTMWSGFGGGCQSNNDGDPVILYDKQAQRWVFSQFSVTTTPYLQCVAVSTTSDATGTYNRYSFQYSNFDDYPKMGVWSDAYYETFNMFNGNTFVGADACAYDRSAMLAGTTATQVCFQQGSGVGGLLPSDLDGLTAPPAGSPNYMIYYGTNSLQLYKFHVDFVTPSNSTFTGPTNIPVAAFSALCGGATCVPQPGVTQQLDSLADRLMFRLAYRNFGSHESLVVNHSVVAGSGGGVRWYEIQNPGGTPTVAQQSTFAPDSNYRWMGSVAMDQSGDLALGYTTSSSSVSPGVRYAGRLASDPASTLEAEITAVSGSGSQNGNLSRWGDYSAMQVDPVDDCTFWFTEEYMKTTGSFNWNTRIVNFKFPTCGTGGGPTASLSPTSLTFGSQTVGTTSSAQNVTLTNSGTASLSITSITTSGDFSQTNTCGASLAASSSCTISVKFTPTAAGTRSGSLSVTDNAPGSPQTASLTGTGVASGPAASLNPTSLNFGNQTVNTTSAAQVVTLTNSGNASLSITSIAVTGNYAQTNNCGASLAASTSCTINVTFTPLTTGTLTGTLSLTDNAPGSPQTASLTGVGVAASTCVTGTLSNGGFETGSLSCWTPGGALLPTPSTVQKHSGSYSSVLGAFAAPEQNGDSYIYQQITIPSNVSKSTLTYYYWPSTTDTITYDWQEAQVRNISGTTLASIMKVGSNAQAWTLITFDLTPYKGQTIQLYFNAHGDGYGDLTYMYLDDVTVTNTTDTSIPTTSITAPANNSTVSGTVTVSATGADVGNPILASMQLFIDGAQVASNTNLNTISYSWNTTTATNGTHTIYSRVTDSGGNTAQSSTVTVTVSNTSTQLIANGGFETGSLSSWTTGGVLAPKVSTTQKHTGSYSSVLGAFASPEQNGDSSIYQTIVVPSTATKVTLTYYYWPSTTDTITYDWQEAQVQNTSGTTLASIMKVDSNAQAWTLVTYDLTAYKGQTVRIYFNAHGDGYGDLTYMYLDDVSVTVQ